MKKLSLTLAIAIIFTAIFSMNVFAAPKVGDEMGDVLTTDIWTYINDQRIPCYNVNNKSVVLLKDLAKYGFDTVYSEKAKTITITFNPTKKVNPVTDFKAATRPSKYVYTDISAIINNRRVECVNIGGDNAIRFSELSDFGTFSWDGDKRETRFTSFNFINSLSDLEKYTGVKYRDTAEKVQSSFAKSNPCYIMIFDSKGKFDLSLKNSFEKNSKNNIKVTDNATLVQAVVTCTVSYEYYSTHGFYDIEKEFDVYSCKITLTAYDVVTGHIIDTFSAVNNPPDSLYVSVDIERYNSPVPELNTAAFKNFLRSLVKD